MLPHRTICDNLDGAWNAAKIDPRRRHRLVAAALPRHGPRRSADDPDVAGLHPRAGRAAGLPRQADPLDGVDLGLRRHRAPPGPNFSYVLATRALRRTDAETRPCRRCASALNGAEPVDPTTFRAFFEAGRALRPASRGVPSRRSAWPRSASPARSPSPGPACSTDWVDRAVLETERGAEPAEPECRGRHASSPCSAPRSPASRSRSSTRRPASRASEREVGELQIRGTSVTPGYYRNRRRPPSSSSTAGCTPATSPTSSTASSWCAGASRTSSSSAAATSTRRTSRRSSARCDGVRPGNVIAFGVDGRQGRAEHRRGGRDPVERPATSWLERSRGSSPTPSVCRRRRSCWSTPGTVPKTSSGKLQRSACKAQYLDGGLSLLTAD